MDSFSQAPDDSRSAAYCRSELLTRDSRWKEMQLKWWQQTYKGATQQDKEKHDLEECERHFSKLGWLEVTDQRLNALLGRAQHARAAKENNKAADVDWARFRSAFPVL